MCATMAVVTPVSAVTGTCSNGEIVTGGKLNREVRTEGKENGAREQGEEREERQGGGRGGRGGCHEFLATWKFFDGKSSLRQPLTGQMIPFLASLLLLILSSPLLSSYFFILLMFIKN